ncbi:hypothetical protein H5410_037534 [Solanum commersonii]|uniref:Uncharacterized protein n=1 Tax=Solanum commersonii TaxID=4109 RepID=A0A9J5YBG6_SOLCO|nr:hypothetical protein H5410_037534 [Solanum commersonii]
MTTEAELVFIPSAGAGHLISAVEIAKLILNRDERLCISILIMKFPMDFGIQSYIESLSSIPRLQFVDISVDEKTIGGFMSNKETFIINFIPSHKPKGFKNPYPAKFLPTMATDQGVMHAMFFDLVTRFKETKVVIDSYGPPPKGQFELPTNYENVQEVLPKGFIERTNEVGKVIGWAPQVAILSHPAVGGFVSHCGWNSVLGSLYFGVPIATWPLFAEQQMNAFALVKELGVGVEIRMDYFVGKYEHVDIVTDKEIESGIRLLMANGDDNEIRKKVKEMKEKSNAAMKEGGSSYASLGLLIEDVISNIS